MPRILIAGTASGSGKTTVSLGIMAAFRALGHQVQPFKVGPDFIDPSHHARVCGLPSRNLDTWMCDDHLVLQIFQRAARIAEVSVIEGVMGLYDGFGPSDDRGSTAHLGKLLRCPTILVIDAGRTSTSAAAIARGFKEYDPEIRLAGVIFNGVGNPAHYAWLREAVERVGIRSLGHLAYNPQVTIPERHLGLVPSPERDPGPDFQRTLLEETQAGLDIAAIMRIAESAPPLPEVVLPIPTAAAKATVAVARDRAINFYYEENLESLHDLGAEIVQFSLLEDSALPATDALYIGGGFPEVFGRELQGNEAMRESVRQAAAAGLPIYAECGGLMYLCREVVDFVGRRHQMVGLVPASAVMSVQLSLGYIEVQALADTLICPKGERFRAQTFHRSVLENVQFQPCYRLHHDQRTSQDGYASGNILAGYVHAYFPNAPFLAARFLERAAAYRSVIKAQVLK